MSTISALADSMNAAATGASSSTTKNDAGSEDRFLKLLVAQMQNQDPMNPLDNAQVTSQMAQINTVSGIDKLNKTVAGLNSQLVQLQALQGVTLVGHDVTVAGDRLSVADGSGVGVGGFELSGAADNVKVEILNAAGKVSGTLNLGAMSSGKHSFEWPSGSVQDADGYRFRVSATSGSASVLSGTLMRDRVDAVSSSGNALNLELHHSGVVSYDTVKAFN
jgi:flagellar basal-body rod modification protein FlgD